MTASGNSSTTSGTLPKSVLRSALQRVRTLLTTRRAASSSPPPSSKRTVASLLESAARSHSTSHTPVKARPGFRPPLVDQMRKAAWIGSDQCRVLSTGVTCQYGSTSTTRRLATPTPRPATSLRTHRTARLPGSLSVGSMGVTIALVIVLSLSIASLLTSLYGVEAKLHQLQRSLDECSSDVTGASDALWSLKKEWRTSTRTTNKTSTSSK